MPPRVLYVEDHDDTRVVISMMLRNAGFEVTEAACGREALGLARAGGFDLYLLDYTFPDASGVTICRAIRELDKETPILFYSGRAMEEEVRAATEAGAQAYLVKPHDVGRIAEHVARWVRQRHPQEG